MSSPTPSPPSLHSEQDDSRDSASSQFSSAVLIKYDSNAEETSLKTDLKASSSTSHGVVDILSEEVNYINEQSFQNCKAEVLSSVPQSFVQDYNSRDSTGFSIQDILGLHQSYVPTTSESLEPRYDYQIPNYESISNSPHTYGSGTDDVITDGSIAKNDNIFTVTPQVANQINYNRSYAANDLVRYNQRSGLDSDDAKDPVRETNELHESGFPNQVRFLNLTLVTIKISTQVPKTTK